MHDAAAAGPNSDLGVRHRHTNDHNTREQQTMNSVSKKVAVIGLGSMGWGAAASLIRAGFETRGVDLRDDVLQRFTAMNGVACTSPAQAADGADVILIFVVDADQTNTVLFGENGALETAPTGAVIVSCATVAPSFAEYLGRRLEERRRLSLDAPVSGGAAKALEGAMTIMASGSDAAFERASPALDAIAAKVYRLGDQPGAGSRIKMINQLLAGVHIATACEAVSFAIKSGIDPNTLYEVICASAGSSWMFQNRVPHILDGDYSPRSAVDIFVKDLGIVLEEGDAAGFPLPITKIAAELFNQASAVGLGREDDAAVAKVYAKQAGISLPEGAKS
jgi:3-hydroxyisobutyrate dehydrogenase